MRKCLRGFILGALCCQAAAPAGAQEQRDGLSFGDRIPWTHDDPFVPGFEADPEVPSADEILGAALGSRLSHPWEIVTCFETWADASGRVLVEEYGRSHEGRVLLRAIITSPTNHARLDAIRQNLRRLANPRELTAEQTGPLIAETPAVAWLGYSIHGDEVSGCDAALAVAYHLAAGTNEEVRKLLDELVVVIDPCMNPDGRQRIINQVEQMAGQNLNLAEFGMHRGWWPYGRGNHYYFDMNRDWLVGSQPETRGRWRAALDLPPQLFVDAHEMGSMDTYLFYPQSKPHNPFLPATLNRWHKEFGTDQANAFDRYGWAYYTREWADGWAPFYSDAWGSLNGAIGILYEQSSTQGFPLRRGSGAVLPYREAVHHQVVSSWANLNTLAEHREAVLGDFWRGRKANLGGRSSGDRMFVLRPGQNPDRERALLKILLAQGIEVDTLEEPLVVQNAVGVLGQETPSLEIAPGSWVVSPRQAQSPILLNLLQFDVPIAVESLARERQSLLQGEGSEMYDATAWSVAEAFFVDAFWCDHQEIPASSATTWKRPPAGIPATANEQAVGWVISGANDSSCRFAVEAMRRGLAVHLATKSFAVSGREFPRGSLLVRANENAENPAEEIQAAAQAAQAPVFPVGSLFGEKGGPDLGGQDFELLAQPKVALFANAPFSPDTLGHLWHHLDVEVGVAVTLLDAHSLGSDALRRFNVLIVPRGRRLGGFLEQHGPALKTFVEQGGTLIACGNSAAALATEETGLSSVRLRRDVLGNLESYALAAALEARGRTHVELSAEDWSSMEEPEFPQVDVSEASSEQREAQDAWRRRFSPSGVFLKAWVDQNSWLTVGMPESMPVFFRGGFVFLSKTPGVTAVQLTGKEQLGLSGLVWPEAKERLAHSAYLTRERMGSGQVILFAVTPAYRGTMRATARLLANAVVYGPGLGATLVRGG